MLEQSLQALESRDCGFFKKALGIKDAWRAFEEFRNEAVYLDIETDGGQSPSSVTVIGLYDGSEFRALIKDRDLDDFVEIVARSKMLVTFYGGGFDLPVLQRRYKEVAFNQIHLDLCPVMKQAGYRGGLKQIERTLGIERAPETQGLSGYDAIRLWNRYYHLDDERALEVLIAYNREDVVNLEKLAEVGYRKLRVQALTASVPNDDATEENISIA